jgi:hypothetical protein
MNNPALRPVIPGARVTLKANLEEGWPEEKGCLISVHLKSYTAIVKLDSCYYEHDLSDDGIREITLDQIVTH